MAAIEAECLRRGGLGRLPPPNEARYVVPVNRHVPLRELFRGEYGRRSILLLVAWILGYSGMVYGFAGYEPALLHAFGLSAGQTFGVLLVSNIGGGCLGLGCRALLGESVERRVTIVISAAVNCAALLAQFFVHSAIAAYVLISVSWGSETVWLFSMYNYTAAAHPTRLRATGTGLTDGLGHLGAVFGRLVAGALFVSTTAAGHVGWFLYVTIPGALLPALLIGWYGINQSRAILEEISG